MYCFCFVCETVLLLSCIIGTVLLVIKTAVLFGCQLVCKSLRQDVNSSVLFLGGRGAKGGCFSFRTGQWPASVVC